MPSNQNNCNDCGCTPNPLNSGNWESESTERRSASIATASTSDGSPSVGPECEIYYNPAHDAVPWTDFQYPAGKDLVSNCESNEISFAAVPLPEGYQISSDGLITWGEESEGEDFEVHGICANKAVAVKTLKTRKLAIWRDGKDVTGKVTPAFAGEKVILEGVVTPKTSSGANWEWTVPEITIKKWDADVNSAKRVDYAPADWKKKQIEVHWVDGSLIGLPKTVTLSAIVDGELMTVETTVSVKRPEIKVTPKVIQPWLEWGEILDPKSWVARMRIEFTRADSLMGGTTQWIQTGKYFRKSIWVNGPDAPYYSPETPTHGPAPAGLDGTYPYQEKDFSTEDNPEAGFPPRMVSKEINYDMQMWLMWKSPKAGEWVPISSVKWWWKGMLKSTGQPNGKTQEPIWAPPGPDMEYRPKKPEFDYPVWTQRLKP